jgi:hypothetical protein
MSLVHDFHMFEQSMLGLRKIINENMIKTSPDSDDD